MQGPDSEVTNLITIKEFEHLVKLMEEMAGAPTEEYGKREPGEICSYERLIVSSELYEDLKKNGEDMRSYIKQQPIPHTPPSR